MFLAKPRSPARVVILTGLALASLMTSACRREGQYLGRRDAVYFGAGNAVAHNKAVHTIDPWPRYAQSNRWKTDGKRMMIGIGRYQANESLEPKGLPTSDATVGVDDTPPPAPPVDANGGSSK